MSWWTPPTFEDEERTHAARMLYTLLGFAIGSLVLRLAHALAQPRVPTPILVLVGTGLLLDGSDPEATPSAITAAWASGIDLCLTKPVDPAEFRAFATRIRKSLDEDGK